MSRLASTLDISGSNNTPYVNLEAKQYVHMAVSSWGTGGEVTAYFESEEDDAYGVESPITTNGVFTQADTLTFQAKVKGRLRLKTTTTGTGSITYELFPGA